MNLQTTPFSVTESKKSYTITTFEEVGITINVLNDKSIDGRKLPSGNLYKFGVLVNDTYHWFFNGEPVRRLQGQKVDRTKMREIFTVLLEISKNTTNTPFVYKVRK